MIQRMGRVGRKGGKATFVLFIPKWSRIKDPDEIDKRIPKSSNGVTAGNAQFSDSNRPKAQAKISPLNQVLNADDDVSDTSSLATSEAGSETDFDINHNDEADLISGVLATEVNETHFNRKKERKISKSDAAKRANLPNEIFDYIYVARCRRLYSLAWYDDMTYAQNDAHLKAEKALPQPCCNGPSCRSQEPDFMIREPFIDTSTPKYTESNREWIAYRTLALKTWRKETSDRLWNAAGVKRLMSESLFMPDACLIALAKSGEILDLGQLIEFLKPWYGVTKYADDILLCLQKNSAPASGLDLLPSEIPSKAQRKAMLKVLWNSKKLKYMDNPLVAEEARITALRDQWLIARGKATPATKARMKKAADAEKRLAERQDKAHEKAKAKNQTKDIRRLAMSNSQAMEVGALKEILSDPVTGPEPQDVAATNPASFYSDAVFANAASISNKSIQAPDAEESPTNILTTVRLSINKKKKAISQTLAGCLKSKSLLSKRARTPTPPPIAMELIRPGKRKVRVTANAIENTPSKRMRQVVD